MTFRFAVLSAAVLAFALSAGCEHSESAKALSWEQERQPPAQPSQTPAASSSSSSSKTPASSSSSSSKAPASSSSSSSKAPASSSAQNPTSTKGGESSGSGSGSADAPAAGDQVSFGALKWRFGGVNGAGAKSSGVAISGASFSSGGMSFKYIRDLSAWGYSSGALGGYACLFVQNSSGTWVGGKFDWISSSRRSRDFNNVYSGYAGWSLSGVPNPCNAAFVILSPDAKKRSNVIVGTWSR